MLELNVIPRGRAPTIYQVTTTPGPVVIGLRGVIRVLLVSKMSGLEKERVVGTSSLTVMFNVADTSPPVLFAQMVY